MNPTQLQLDYARVERAIAYLNEHRGEQPSLAEVARSVHLSEFHFQRMFRRWAGVSPKRYLQLLTAEHARELLRASRSVLDTTFDTGLSGPGRLHELFVALEAMSPGEFKAQGAGLELAYGTVESPFGPCTVVLSARGICNLEFHEVGGEGEGAKALLARLRGELPRAGCREDRRAAVRVVHSLFEPVEQSGTRERLTLCVRGTNFQVQVWRALLKIPPGAVATYGQIAAWLGRPSASRAIGQAVGANPVAVLIPCHRVIRENGGLGGYRWGTVRKQAMLLRESASLTATA